MVTEFVRKIIIFSCGMVVMALCLWGPLGDAAWLNKLVSSDSGRHLVACLLPFAGVSGGGDSVPETVWQGMTEPQNILASVSGAFSGVDASAATNATENTPQEETPVTTNEEPKTNTKAAASLSDQPLVGIYCTHSAESYPPTSGQSSTSGKNGDIFQVAQALQAELASLGVQSVLCDTVHDSPEWNKSYQNSLASMKKMKEENPSLELFVDVHRDSKINMLDTVTEINGEKVAKMMLVVGSNQRSKHDNWQQNLAFAKKVGAKVEELYPGVLRDVKVQSGRYNQHFSPQAILVEVGSTENTLQEAQRAAALLAGALNAILRE